jgi:putative transposase
MRMDYRAGPSNAWLDRSDTSTFSWWLTLKTANGPVALPILGWGRDDGERKQGARRAGVLGKTVNLVSDDDGSLRVVLNRDVTDVFAASREAYQPLLDILALDYGLNSLFATSEGDLLGRGFKKKLLPLTDRADAIARREQRAGRKPRDCAAYRRIIERIRGLIETEVNRALNQSRLPRHGS